MADPGPSISSPHPFPHKRFLLALDLNGCLCLKVKHDDPPLPSDFPISDLKVLQLKFYKVIERRGANDFVNRLLDICDVGILTSTTKPNADQMIDLILEPEVKAKLKFIWYRDDVEVDLNGKEDYATVKKLKSVVRSAAINIRKDGVWRYSMDRALIADNSLSKIDKNPISNMYLFPAYTGSSDDKSLDEIRLEIEARIGEMMKD